MSDVERSDSKLSSNSVSKMARIPLNVALKNIEKLLINNQPVMIAQQRNNNQMTNTEIIDNDSDIY